MRADATGIIAGSEEEIGSLVGLLSSLTDLGELRPFLPQLAVDVAKEVARCEYQVKVAVRIVELDL